MFFVLLGRRVWAFVGGGAGVVREISILVVVITNNNGVDGSGGAGANRGCDVVWLLVGVSAEAGLGEIRWDRIYSICSQLFE